MYMTHTSIVNFPYEIQNIIAQHCDEKTLAAVGGTCSSLRHLYTNFWMSERVAARRVFYTPSLYPRLEESMKRKRLIALNALTKDPECIESALTPLPIQQDLEMRKTALVASYFLHKEDLYQTLKREPALAKVALELEKPIKRLSQNSELWSLQPFVLYSPVVLYKNVPEEIANHIDIALENLKQRKIEPDSLSRRLRQNREVVSTLFKTSRKGVLGHAHQRSKKKKKGTIQIFRNSEREAIQTGSKANLLCLQTMQEGVPVPF